MPPCSKIKNPWAFIRITIYFAYALNGPWDFASNPEAISIVP